LLNCRSAATQPGRASIDTSSTIRSCGTSRDQIGLRSAALIDRLARFEQTANGSQPDPRLQQRPVGTALDAPS